MAAAPNAAPETGETALPSAPLEVVPSTGAEIPPATSPTTAVTPSQVVPDKLTGKDFSGVSYNPPRVDPRGTQLFQHYGATSATITLKNPVNRITVDLKPRSNDDSFPVVILTARRTSNGPYLNKAILQKEVIREEGPIVREISLDAGTYEITLGYYGSSAETRTGLELRSVTFE